MGSLQFPNMGMGLRLAAFGRRSSAINKQKNMYNKKSVNYFIFSLGGTAGDALTVHRGQLFTTKDQDNDISKKNCARAGIGAWWYYKCHHSNLNGLYHQGGSHSSFGDGINWKHWKGYKYSAKRAEMKIRPVNF